MCQIHNIQHTYTQQICCHPALHPCQIDLLGQNCGLDNSFPRQVPPFFICFRVVSHEACVDAEPDVARLAAKPAQCSPWLLRLAQVLAWHRRHLLSGSFNSSGRHDQTELRSSTEPVAVCGQFHDARQLLSSWESVSALSAS